MKAPLAPPLTSALPGPTPCRPALFLGVSEWFAESCGDVLRNDLVFSTNAKAIHPILQGKKEQALILNFLNGKELLVLSNALNGGSTIVTDEDVLNDSSLATKKPKKGWFRGVIFTDDWFDVDPEFRTLANIMIETLKTMYDSGCSVIVVASMGVFSVPQTLSSIFQLAQPWNLTAYTSKSLITTPIGKPILGNAFPNKGVYAKANFIQAPWEESLLIEESINPEDYDSDEEAPEPDTDSPIVVHKNKNGGCVCYFGFVNDLDVSYGAIMLQLLNLANTSGDDLGHGTEMQSIQNASADGGTIRDLTSRMEDIFHVCSDTSSQVHALIRLVQTQQAQLQMLAEEIRDIKGATRVKQK
jgi:hypothetical protein